jgi:hypothetical protein
MSYTRVVSVIDYTSLFGMRLELASLAEAISTRASHTPDNPDDPLCTQIATLIHTGLRKKFDRTLHDFSDAIGIRTIFSSGDVIA